MLTSSLCPLNDFYLQDIIVSPRSFQSVWPIFLNCWYVCRWCSVTDEYWEKGRFRKMYLCLPCYLCLLNPNRHPLCLLVVYDKDEDVIVPWKFRIIFVSNLLPACSSGWINTCLLRDWLILVKGATVSLKDVQESWPTQTISIIKCHHHHVRLLCGWLKLGKGATVSLKDVCVFAYPNYHYHHHHHHHQMSPSSSSNVIIIIMFVCCVAG